jgi:hypothetical protein
MPDGDLVFYVKLDLKPECVQEWRAAVAAVIEGCPKKKHLSAAHYSRIFVSPLAIRYMSVGASRPLRRSSIINLRARIIDRPTRRACQTCCEHRGLPRYCDMSRSGDRAHRRGAPPWQHPLRRATKEARLCGPGFEGPQLMRKSLNVYPSQLI